MSLIVRNDEQIKVGLTTGLVAGSSSFTFDGSGNPAVPDYRNFKIVISELNGRGIMVEGLDYSWNYTTGVFTLLLAGDIFAVNQWYNVHFQDVNVPFIVNHAAIINYLYFIRDITIPNIDPSPSAKNAPILERLNSFIAKYEPECCVGILGYALYKALLNENSSRMDDLLYGAEYTDNCGNLQKWRGLVYEPKISLIANYIYYWFQSASATQTTGVSTSVSKTEAGTSVSPADKMIDAWNFFSSEVNELNFFLWTKNNIKGTSAVYPEFTNAHFWKSRAFSHTINFLGL